MSASSILSRLRHKGQITEAEYRKLMDIIDSLPSVRPSRKGHWTGATMTYRYRCSECGNMAEYEENFCPNCGARMDEPQESEDKE